MKKLGLLLLAMGAGTLSGCIRESRIAMSSDLAANTERLELTGMGFGQRGDFDFAGSEGRFTRGADRLQLLDAVLVSNSGGGTFRHAGLEGACSYREREINIGAISLPERPFLYRCSFGRNGLPAGELVIEEETGTAGSLLSKRGRRGFMTFAGERYTIKSIHREQGGGLASGTALGYRFDHDGREIGAVDLNGENKTVFAPRGGGAREAVFAGSLALSVLWDPAKM